MHEYGDCSFCGGKVEEDKVEMEYRYKEKLYVFQNVPAGVCIQCGERYVTAAIAEEIESRIQINHKWDKTIPVPVDVLPEGVAV